MIPIVCEGDATFENIFYSIKPNYVILFSHRYHTILFVTLLL